MAEPVTWCLEHVHDPLLASARERLLQCDHATDAERILNVVYPRCGLNLAEVLPARLVVHRWTQLMTSAPSASGTVWPVPASKRHRTLLSMQGVLAPCCFVCRRTFTEDTGDLWPWLAATRDADMLPMRQHVGIYMTDLRPKWPVPPT